LTAKKRLCKVIAGLFIRTFSRIARNLTTEEESMTMRIQRGVLMLATVALLGMPLVAQADNKHVSEAIEHAKEAAAHGKQGHADALVKHAEGALHHAEAAQKDVKNPHLDEGVKELKAAVEHGKAGHADVATKHAEGAVTHLSEVK
jgi:small metal-binding protein